MVYDLGVRVWGLGVGGQGLVVEFPGFACK